MDGKLLDKRNKVVLARMAETIQKRSQEQADKWGEVQALAVLAARVTGGKSSCYYHAAMYGLWPIESTRIGDRTKACVDLKTGKIVGYWRTPVSAKTIINIDLDDLDAQKVVEALTRLLYEKDPSFLYIDVGGKHVPAIGYDEG